MIYLMFGNIILIFMLLSVYILNTIKVLKYYQNDNYHLRSIKQILKEDLIKKPYIFFLFLFIFVTKTNNIKILLIVILLMILVENMSEIKLKLKFISTIT